MSVGEDGILVPAVAPGSVMDSWPEPPAWTGGALCAQTDPELFFPDMGGSTRNAKRVCADCPVREACLADALARDERYGIWGGLSVKERRKLLRGAS